jgi:glycerate kinase
MRIVIAPDSFKGSLSSIQAAQAVERGVLKAAARVGRKVEIAKIPIADGGEGTVEAIIAGAGGEIIPARVLDPLGREIDSFFGVLPDRTGVIEMAAASGLDLIKPEERDPLVTTSFGTGQLILKALDAGCVRLIIGIGGSATNDGGVGMAQALGGAFPDRNRQPIGFGGGELGKIEKIDLSGLDPRIAATTVIVASDVKNVLCGPDGASAVYGPQKGATPEMVAVLDRNLGHLAEKIKADLGKDISLVPGSGAAGGLGGGLMAFLNAEIRPGIEIVMEITGFREKVREADLIFTGEGATDFQTMFGKVPYGVAQVAAEYGKPVLCISGTLGNGYQKLFDAGIKGFFSIVDRPMTLEEAMERGEELLETTAENVMNTYFIGG